MLPDFSLERFEWRDFAVARNQPANISGCGGKFFFGAGFDPDGRARGSGGAPGGTEVGDDLFGFGVRGICVKKFFDVRGGVGEESFEDEVHGSGGAFDVEEEGAGI